MKIQISLCFKPYYKWITFNTPTPVSANAPSLGFKPYYKWITFNTVIRKGNIYLSIDVLNLIINGLPSIRNEFKKDPTIYWCFKPYYKWITFNTLTL